MTGDLFNGFDGYEPPRKPGPKLHGFTRSAERSRQFANAPWWYDVYRLAFGNSLASVVYVNGDGWAQRGGIDRVLTLTSGRTVTVDEKVREEVYPDILLEQWSDTDRRIPGWIQKSLACDYLAYAFIPTETCYLLPVLTLQRAWRMHGQEWIRECGNPVRAFNEERGRRWTTTCIPVPIPVLMDALSDAMKVVWTEEAA